MKVAFRNLELELQSRWLLTYKWNKTDLEPLKLTLIIIINIHYLLN